MEIRPYSNTCPEIESVYNQISRELSANVYDRMKPSRAIRFALYKLGYQRWRGPRFIEWNENEN